jgi:hypothetical protein
MKKKIIILLLIISGFTLKAQTPVDIYYHVPFIPQPTDASCWSASIAMILWWRDCEDAQMSLVDALTPEQVAGNIGYWQQFFYDGLSSFDAHPLDVYNLVSVQPMSFPVATLAGFLEHGPMWVAYNGCANPLTECGHAVVLIGMHGDGTPQNTEVILHDPDDGSGIYPNLGERDRVMPYTEFIDRLNERATQLLSLPEARNNPVSFLAYPRQPSDTQRSADEVQQTSGL